MKKFVKYAAVGLAGYFIGFYEMKYKVMEALVEVLNNQDVDKESEE